MHELLIEPMELTNNTVTVYARLSRTLPAGCDVEAFEKKLISLIQLAMRDVVRDSYDISLTGMSTTGTTPSQLTTRVR